MTIYYLEMTSPSCVNDKTGSGELDLRECVVRQYQYNRFLYQWIGAPWAWTDKLDWTEQQWRDYAEDAGLRTWVAYCQGSPAGYFELQQQACGDVEIVYFGLAQGFIGRGHGGYLLSQALRLAWGWQGTSRVWVHTCSRDHPGALQNYRSRGMALYRVEQE